MRTLQRRKHKSSGMYHTLSHEYPSKVNEVTKLESKATPAQAQSDFDREYEAFIAEQKAKKAARLAAEAEAAAAEVEEKAEEPVAETVEETPVAEEIVSVTEEEAPAAVEEAAPVEEPVAETKKSRKKKAAVAE